MQFRKCTTFISCHFHIELPQGKRDGYEGVKDDNKRIPRLDANAFDQRGTKGIAELEKKYLSAETLKK